MPSVRQSRYLITALTLVFLLILAYLTPHTALDTSKSSSKIKPNPIFREQKQLVFDHTALIHDKSLGVFSDIYVIHLPHRVDRLKRIIHISKLLDIQFTLVNATSAEDAVIPAIMAHIQHEYADAQRRNEDDSNQYTLYLLDALNMQNDPLSHSLGAKGSDLWTTPKELALFADHQHSQDRNVKEERVPFGYQVGHKQIMTPAIIACWFSHIRTLRHIINTGVVAALILEDDIDLEIDIENRISSMWPALPVDWDIVYLGHCWSKENSKKQIAPNLHPSTSPNCNHAYAISRRGAMRVLRHLRSPRFAFSRPFDRALLHLIKSGRLRSFSVFPSIAIQTRDNLSDISEGNGTSWRDELINGALSNTVNNE